MQSQIIGKIITSLSTSKLDENETIEFNLPGYKPMPITKSNFHAIKSYDANEYNKDDKILAKKIAFIDGGNSEIISAPNLSLHFVRIFACIFQQNKRIESRKNEFYVLARTVNKEGSIYYETELFPVTGELLADKNDLCLACDDKTIRQGINNASISVIGEIARKFSEIALAREIIAGLNEHDIIVLDGTLQAVLTGQKKYLDNLYEAASYKKTIVSALSKTTRIFTASGNSIIGLLEDIAPEGAWYYHPVVEIKNENHKAEMFFVKLHEKSEYVFRYEIFNGCLAEKYNGPGFLSVIFSAIANNSRDFAFPGYPYGLIFADKLARVSNNEREYLITMLQAKSGKSWSIIKKYLNAVNAHDVLDRIG